MECGSILYVIYDVENKNGRWLGESRQFLFVIWRLVIQCVACVGLSYKLLTNTQPTHSSSTHTARERAQCDKFRYRISIHKHVLWAVSVLKSIFSHFDRFPSSKNFCLIILRWWFYLCDRTILSLHMRVCVHLCKGRTIGGETDSPDCLL